MSSGRMRHYVQYGLTLLQEKGHASILLRAMGRAINKSVAIGEWLGMHAQCAADMVGWKPFFEMLRWSSKFMKRRG